MANTGESQTEADCADAKVRISASISSRSTQPVPKEYFIYRRGDITPICPVSIEFMLLAITWLTSRRRTGSARSVVRQRMQDKNVSESHLLGWR